MQALIIHGELGAMRSFYISDKKNIGGTNSGPQSHYLGRGPAS